jgi:hypothetical protein
MDLHPDFSDLLAAFVSAEVRFALLGGYAVGYYGKPRATKDLDLLVSGRSDNLSRVAKALDAFGAPANVVEAARVQSESEVVFLGVPPVRVDILRTVDGLDTEEALNRVVNVRVGALAIPILSLDDLITNKRASGRPQDLADAATLEAVRVRTESE